MKKFVFACMAFLAFVACSEDRAPFNYRGLAFTMPVTQFVDSLVARGFAVDSAASDSGQTVVLAGENMPYRVLVAFSGEQLQVVQENYIADNNDSTRVMWQRLHDNLEKELDAWPDCPILKDDHKVANFDTSDGFISVVLENTYTPTLTVRYTPKKEEK